MKDREPDRSSDGPPAGAPAPGGSSPRPGRLPSPPAWLVRGLRPQPAPIPWAAAARAAVALAAPLAAGIAAGLPSYGALASMGALSGVIGDTADAYRMRLLNIAVPQLLGAVGVTLGTLVHGQGWVAVGVLTAVALVSGMISSIGSVASVSGLLLLLNAVVGAGLPMPQPWWKAPVLLCLGGLFVLVLTLLGWPLRRRAAERSAVAAAYASVAELFAVAGTPDTAAYDARRHEVTRALDASYDLILARRAREHGRVGPMVRLLAQLNALIPLVESAPAAHRHGRSSRSPEVAAAVRTLADAVASGRGGAAEPPGLPPPEGPADRAVENALRHAAAVVRNPDADVLAEDRLGVPAELGVRARRAARAALLSRESWRYGLRLALCIGVAQSFVSLVPVERSYWVALTVTFVLKPDFGSVFSRAVLRALGTAAGLLVAAPLLASVPRGWADVPVMMALAALIPVFSARGYAFQTAAVTPVILLLSDVLNQQGLHLVLPRLVDSLTGCAIVLVAGYLLWPESWHTRVGDRVADAVEETARYVAGSFGGVAHAERVRRRRRLYRDLSAVRSEFQRALTEPPPAGERAAAWWPLVVAVERVVDATTAARVRVDHGAAAPRPEEVAEVERQLYELAEGVRSSTELVEVRAELPGDERGVLEPLRREVRAARAVASPNASP
ncbi:FUSC family protein [Streptomyces sp. C10-9-1]|uniref:FUSC family protein n=1 Tax=Streptomyces sp. C10-9-1 TaxID=1859285 RepID=UPI003D71E620